MSDEKNGLSVTFVPGRVGIVGLGLIGGSFAKALHAGGTEVYAYNRTHSTLELAMIDTVDGELDDTTIGSCELIILAGYPASSVEWLENKAELISPGAIVIDAVGVKRNVCTCCQGISAGHGWTFVGCHPMAGMQFSGYAHATADLYKGAPMVVVPPEMDDISRVIILERIEHLLAPCGFGSYTLSTAEHHDQVIAFTSQLAHVVSNAYVKSPMARVHEGFSAGSYKDLTRVARLNPDMWTELFLENADYLSNEIATLINNLSQYKEALDERDETRLHDLLAEGDRIKRSIEGQQ